METSCGGVLKGDYIMSVCSLPYPTDSYILALHLAPTFRASSKMGFMWAGFRKTLTISMGSGTSSKEERTLIPRELEEYKQKYSGVVKAEDYLT
jgi:hypothetical protein